MINDKDLVVGTMHKNEVSSSSGPKIKRRGDSGENLINPVELNGYSPSTYALFVFDDGSQKAKAADHVPVCVALLGQQVVGSAGGDRSG